MTIADLIRRLQPLTPTEGDWDLATSALTDSNTQSALRAIRLLTELRSMGFAAPFRLYDSPIDDDTVRIDWFFNYTAGCTDYTFCQIETNVEGAEVFISDGTGPVTYERLEG